MNDVSLEYLTKAINGEAQAYLQYQADAAVLRNLGMNRLAERSLREATEEEGHRKRFMDRATLLDGDPYPASVDVMNVSGAGLENIFENVATLERSAIALYTEAASALFQEDRVTSDLFASILADEQEHLNWVETQLSIINVHGLDIYAIMQATRD